MARGGREKSSYIADPERRTYYRNLRTIRTQVLKEHAEELARTGFLGRVFLRIRIEREIKRRYREAEASPR